MLTVSPSGVVRLPTVVVLGDSLAVSPSLDASFPAVLQRRLDAEGLRWRVVNAGHNGDTTAQGLARLDQVLASEPQILVLSLGANDGLRGVPVETVRAQLDSIIRRALGRAGDRTGSSVSSRVARVLLCGMETPPLRGWPYTAAFHDIYPGLARVHQVPLVPFLLTGVVGERTLNLRDMVHPNAAGAQRIAETVWPYLVPMLTEWPWQPRSQS